MEIAGGKLIGFQLVRHPWGPECLYGIIPDDGSGNMDEVFSVESEKMEEEEVQKLIQAHFDAEHARRKAILEERVVPEPMAQVVTKEVVEAYLKSEKYIRADQSIEQVKTEMAKVG
jgi:hypothetical protein